MMKCLDEICTALTASCEFLKIRQETATLPLKGPAGTQRMLVENTPPKNGS